MSETTEDQPYFIKLDGVAGAHHRERSYQQNIFEQHFETKEEQTACQELLFPAVAAVVAEKMIEFRKLKTGGGKPLGGA